jgi:toxin ParE1/3/4
VSLPIVFRPEALDDLAAAFQWYEDRQPGLGREFMVAVEEKLGHVSTNPRRYQQLRGPARRAITRHFPYGIFFVEEDSRVVVLGVLHHARHPKHWRARST